MFRRLNNGPAIQVSILLTASHGWPEAGGSDAGAGAIAHTPFRPDRRICLSHANCSGAALNRLDHRAHPRGAVSLAIDEFRAKQNTHLPTYENAFVIP